LLVWSESGLWKKNMSWIPRNTSEWARGIKIENPGAFSPLLVRIANRVLWPLVRMLFRPQLKGVENLPRDRPYLLVANHSAGAGIAEIMCIIALYLRHVGPTKPLAGFALPQMFRVYPLSRLMKSVGAIPSTYDAAQRALKENVPILVFPGGNHETLRPVWKANQVDFCGRTGFLKIAREAGVPIIPLGIRGAHYTCPIFVRSKLLSWLLLVPRVLSLKRWAISLTGVFGATAILALTPLNLEWRILLTWLWLGSPIVFIPIIPWNIRLRIGQPLEPHDLFEDQSEHALHRALQHVQSEVEALIAVGNASGK